MLNKQRRNGGEVSAKERTNASKLIWITAKGKLAVGTGGGPWIKQKTTKSARESGELRGLELDVS